MKYKLKVLKGYNENFDYVRALSKNNSIYNNVPYT